MTQIISSVPMQPNQNAVERPMTLIEKLERVIIEHNAEFNKFIDEATDHQKIAHTAVLAGLLSAIKVAKQHSDWISVDERLPTENDGRVSWGVNAYKKYILVNIVSRGIAMTCRFNLTDKCFETADKVTHWQPMPQPPSEVQE